jgi:transcriptional regulator with XRE-family HTH domain
METKNRFKEIRKQLRFSQKELAELLGITNFTISRYESETHQMQPSFSVMLRLVNIAKKYGVKIRIEDIRSH